MQQQAQQGIAATLAAGEDADLLEHVFVRKQEATEQAAQFGLAGGGRRIAEVIEDPGVGIEFLVLVLCEIVGFHVVAEAVFAVRDLFGSGEQLDQRGFARAVHADQGDAVSALDHEIDVAEYFFVHAAIFSRIGFGDAFELGHDASAGFGLRERKVDRLFFWGNLDALDLFQFLDAALYLLSFRCLVAEAVDEDFELLDAVALVAVSGCQLFVALRLLGEELVVISGVEPEAFVPDFGDFVDGDVQEVAVVRDQHEGVRIVLQIFFQPVAGFKIEMVGGLVEQ